MNLWFEVDFTCTRFYTSLGILKCSQEPRLPLQSRGPVAKQRLLDSHRMCFSFQKYHIVIIVKYSTVGCHNNAAQYNFILHTTLQWLVRNLATNCPHRNHDPITKTIAIQFNSNSKQTYCSTISCTYKTQKERHSIQTFNQFISSFEAVRDSVYINFTMIQWIDAVLQRTYNTLKHIPLYLNNQSMPVWWSHDNKDG